MAGISGQFSTRFHGSSSSANGYYLILDYSQSDPLSETAIRENATNLTLTLKLKAIGSSYKIISSANKTVKMGIKDGEIVSSTCKIGIDPNKEKTLFTHTYKVKHNSDGTCATKIRAYCNVQVTLSGTWYERVYVPEEDYKEIILNPIPRPSSLTMELQQGNLGDTINFSIEKTPGVEVLNTFSYSVDDLQSWISFDEENFNLEDGSWYIDQSFGNYFPNNTELNLAIKCESSYDSTPLGQNIQYFKIKCPESFGPQGLNFTIIPKTQGLPEDTEFFIYSKTNLEFDLRAKSQAGARIENYSLTIVTPSTEDFFGINFAKLSPTFSSGLDVWISQKAYKLLNSSFSLYGENIFSQNNDFRFIITVTDSRGYTKSQLYPQSGYKTFLNYSAPVIYGVEVQKGSFDENGNFNKNSSGQYIQLNCSYSASELIINNEGEESNINKLFYTLEKITSTGMTKILLENVELTNFSDSEFSINEKNLNLPEGEEELVAKKETGNYTLRLIIKDSFSSVVELSTIKLTGTLLNFGAYGMSAAIGGPADTTAGEEGSFRVYYKTTFQNGIEYKLINNKEDLYQNLNNIMASGWYKIENYPPERMEENPTFSYDLGYPSAYDLQSYPQQDDICFLEVKEADSGNVIIQQMTWVSIVREVSEKHKVSRHKINGEWSYWSVEGMDFNSPIDYNRIIASDAQVNYGMITNGEGSFKLEEMGNYINSYIRNYFSNNFKNQLLETIYPIGSIYISTNNTSPAILLGGEWTPIKDKFLLAGNTAYPPGTSGGYAAASIPNHKHGSNVGAAKIGNTSSYNTLVACNRNGLYSGGEIAIGYGIGVPADLNDKGTFTADALMYTTQAGAATISTLPPYLSVYVWQRTA